MKGQSAGNTPGLDEQKDSARLMQAAPKAFAEVPYFTFGRGIGILPADSLFSFNLRIRMQNRLGITALGGDIEQIEARVRRLRLRFDGFVWRPEIYYVIQLSFSRGDLDWENTGFPNVVRDAMIFYKPGKKWQFGFGQTKLPGNRQRINSSGDLQFVDRSLVNATFNIDRDFGLQAAYTERWFLDFYTVLRGALSSGDGRNVLSTNKGLAYTGRIEVLPLGQFQKFGDYFEGDLLREPRPKIAMGFTYSYNAQTLRTGGQTGLPLFEPRNMRTWAGDFLLKYKGWALSSEWMYRKSENPLTINNLGEMRYVYVGFGHNHQLSYLWPNQYELAIRYTQMAPSLPIQEFEPGIQEFTLGASKYLRGHRLKIQTDLSYTRLQPALTTGIIEPWTWRFQVEIGI